MAKLLLTASVAIFLATLVFCNASQVAEAPACCCNGGGGGSDLSALNGLTAITLALVLALTLGLLCLLCCLLGGGSGGCSSGEFSGLLDDLPSILAGLKLGVLSNGDLLNIGTILGLFSSGDK